MRVIESQASLPLAVTPATSQTSKAERLMAAATLMVAHLARGETLDAHRLRASMTEAFGASDSEGAWSWKDAYEATEAAQVIFLRRVLPLFFARKISPDGVLARLCRIAELLPTQTRRSEESQALQQFSTPIELAYAASVAAGLSPSDCVLEPSAGTGLLAVFAEAQHARLHLNEIADTRYALLGRLFAGTPVTRLDAEQIHDRLDRKVVPSVVLMNPPFSAALHVTGPRPETALHHLRSALARLPVGGRLVAITGANLSPCAPAFADGFAAIRGLGDIVFTAAMSGAAYYRHGTATETRLTVIERGPTGEVSLPTLPTATSAADLLAMVQAHVPPRRDIDPASLPAAASDSTATLLTLARAKPRPETPKPAARPASADIVELAYGFPADGEAAERPAISDQLYEPYRVASIRIEAAQPHPTTLVQSAAMASVNPPKPSYRPHLPKPVSDSGLLSDAQLESVIYAGEAHATHLAGRWVPDASFDTLRAARDDEPDAVTFRRGWFLGDGTGAGKGRQIAGIVLDNFLKGRRKALWISKSDKLIEDAQRDWSALGQEKLQIVPIDRFKQGAPITLHEGILFVTYATLRSAEREGKASRLTQIVNWLGKEFDGAIIFDEAHAMGNAAGGKGSRGNTAPSQQGLAGLRLQHRLPDARVVYVSATGATTVENLAYAQRLGLWGGDDFPFASRNDFVTAVTEGGIATMEVLARDLKALGLYAARSLSYEGVEVEMLEHALTPEQIAIYDAYARAFQIIHKNLTKALEAAGVTSAAGETLNRNAKAAARSAFESNKQRFFNHLITAMKVPSLIAAIRRDMEAGHAAVIQLVTTSEALMERRLAQIPPGEWGDLSIDITPREYVLDYLAHAFPTQLYETYSDEEGNIRSRPVEQDGQPVVSRAAEALRDALIEHLAALPPVQSALDQIIQTFGTERVAEVTGRGRRIVRKDSLRGPVLAVENRSAAANLAETQAFMDDRKRILVFSDAGGTGRSYHAEKSARNQRLRVHYMLEAGWKADAAIQGLGRTNRTNQAQPPLFRPVATDVRGEKRFLSTIARRLDSLGAITRGQRQTGGQGLFRAEDNLESRYARDALRQLYTLIWRGKVESFPLRHFEDITALSLATEDGSLRDDLPPISTFLNRLLALEIDAQNRLFDVFDSLIAARIDSAIAAGTYEAGLETIRAESLAVRERIPIARHEATGAETQLYAVTRKDRNTPRSLEDALRLGKEAGGRLVANAKSGRAAVILPGTAWTLDDGTVEPRLRILKPMDSSSMAAKDLADTHWETVDATTFAALWQKEIDALPEFSVSTFHVVTGLLLPVWKRLPFENPRVYRFETDDGERVIGRLVPPTYLEQFNAAATVLAPADAYAAALSGAPVRIGARSHLGKVRVMHAERLELTGFDASALPRLKAHGLMSEIIAWRTRLFVPIGDRAVEIIRRLQADPCL